MKQLTGRRKHGQPFALDLISVGGEVESPGEGQNSRLDVLDGFFTLAAQTEEYL